MFSILSSVLNAMNSQMKSKDYIRETELNRKLMNQNIYEPVSKKNDFIYGKQGKEKQLKVTQRSLENKIRRILQNHFGYEFRKVRPQFLKSEITNKCLELDMFCENLNLAVEYQGQQHTNYIPFFHKRGEKQFQEQLIRDHMKFVKCKQNNVKLVIVHYYEINDNMLDSEILQLLLEKISKVL